MSSAIDAQYIAYPLGGILQLRVAHDLERSGLHICEFQDVGPNRAAGLIQASTVEGNVTQRVQHRLARLLVMEQCVQRLRFDFSVRKKLRVSLNPERMHARMREQNGLPRCGSLLPAEVEALKIAGEQGDYLRLIAVIMAALTDASLKITQVMIAEKKGHIVRMLLLELEDSLELLKCHLRSYSLMAVWIKVITQENDPSFLISRNGLSPECPSMDVRDDNRVISCVVRLSIQQINVKTVEDLAFVLFHKNHFDYYYATIYSFLRRLFQIIFIHISNGVVALDCKYNA